VVAFTFSDFGTVLSSFLTSNFHLRAEAISHLPAYTDSFTSTHSTAVTTANASAYLTTFPSS
jgi:hypothetical protein